MNTTIADSDFTDTFLENKSFANFVKGNNQLSYQEPFSDEDTIALSWKTLEKMFHFHCTVETEQTFFYDNLF